MRKILGVLLTSTVLTTAAFANAGPAPMATPCPACPEAPVTKWSGFKLGAQAGYGQTNVIAKGAIGGVHAGYDFQIAKNWIVGANTSFDMTSIKALGIKAKYTVAVVPRIGIVMNDSLFYVGAGWAGTKFNRGGFEDALRISVGAGQKINRALLGVEVNYDHYDANIKNLSGMVKLSFCL